MPQLLADCTLPLLGDAGNTTFDSCVAVTDSLHVMWSLLPGEDGAPDQMLWGLAGVTDGQGYVAVGFPSEPGMSLTTERPAAADLSAVPAAGPLMWEQCRRGMLGRKVAGFHCNFCKGGEDAFLHSLPSGLLARAAQPVDTSPPTLHLPIRLPWPMPILQV